MNQDLHNRVAAMLNGQVSAQPTGADVKVDDKPANAEKVRSRKGDGTNKLRNVNAFNPHKQYSVSVIDKAKARLG